MIVAPPHPDKSNRTTHERVLSTAADEAVLIVTRLDLRTEDAIRLKRMGICEGRQIQLVQKGDPLIVRVVGCRVGIASRREEKLAAASRAYDGPDKLLYHRVDVADRQNAKSLVTS